MVCSSRYTVAPTTVTVNPSLVSHVLCTGFAVNCVFFFLLRIVAGELAMGAALLLVNSQWERHCCW